MAKEEKEAKKKTSRKNGDCLMIQKTPMVKIHSADLDYASNDEDDFSED